MKKGDKMYLEYTEAEQKKIQEIIDSYTPERERLSKAFNEILEDPEKEEERHKILIQQQTVIDSLQAEVEAYLDKIQRKRFKPIKEAGTEAIIAHAKEQIPLVLDEIHKDATRNYGKFDPAALKELQIGVIKDGTFFISAYFAAELLKDEMRLHLEALKDNKAAIQGLLKDIIEAVENSPYTENIEISEDLKKPFLAPIPNGESLAFLYKILNMKAGRTILEPGSNRHNIIKSMANETMTTLKYTSENKQRGTSIEVTITQADEYLRKSRKTTEKILTYVLQTMTNQYNAWDVELFLNDLVEAGLYSTTSNAKRGVIEFFEQQKHITLKGAVKKNGKTIVEEGGILFYGYKFDKGKGVIKLHINENFNMDFIANYYSVFPRFAYALKNNNAFTLVRYVLYLARQNTRDIKEKGWFKIGLEAIRENLGLPSVDEVKNRKYKQYIIEPIEKAIEEIEEALQNVPEAQNRSFTITPKVPENANISEWLNGYIEVGLAGDFADTFINIATKAEADRKKWERIKMTQQARLEVQQKMNKHKK